MNVKQAPTGSQSSLSAERATEILKTRARELARPLSEQQAAGEVLQVVGFRLAQEKYALEQRYVREVHSLRDVTVLPCTPKFVLGLINMRGQILPVIDIKRFFDLPETGITDLHMVIIVHANDVELGILADAVTGVEAVPVSDMQPSLPTLTGIRAQYLKGVTSDRTVILDVQQILSDPKIVVNEEVEN